MEFGAGISQSQVATHIGGYGQDLSLVLSSGESIRLEYAVNGDRSGQTSTANLKVRFANGCTWDWKQIEQELAKPQTGTQGADTLYGYANNSDVFYGVGGDDQLLGEGGNDVLDGGAGNDHLGGGIGNDVYLLGKTDGIDVLDEYYDLDVTRSKLNTLRFKAGVSPSEVTLRRNYNHLEFSIGGTSDKVTANWFYESATGPTAGPKSPIQQVGFAYGTVWDLVTSI